MEGAGQKTEPPGINDRPVAPLQGQVELGLVDVEGAHPSPLTGEPRQEVTTLKGAIGPKAIDVATTDDERAYAPNEALERELQTQMVVSNEGTAVPFAAPDNRAIATQDEGRGSTDRIGRVATTKEVEEPEKRRSKENGDIEGHDTPEKPAVMIDCKAWVFPRQSGEVGIQFVVAKKDIEDQSGTKLKVGSAYRFDVSVEGAFKFESHRVMSNDRYLHFYLPSKNIDKVTRGETYRLTFSSISEESPPVRRAKPAEVGVLRGDSLETRESHLAVALSKAYRGSGEEPKVYFSVNKSRLERLGGIAFEEGRDYRISGRIGGVCRFELSHHERGYANTLTITAPKEHTSAFRIGEKYRIVVDSIKQKRDESSDDHGEMEFSWDWKTVAAWVDTEGSFQMYPNTNRAVIAQKERAPLEGIRAFLASEGLPSDVTIQHRRERTYYQLGTRGGIEKLAEFVKNVEPYIVTENKKGQVARLKEKLSRMPEHEGVHRRRARRILGLS